MVDWAQSTNERTKNVSGIETPNVGTDIMNSDLQKINHLEKRKKKEKRKVKFNEEKTKLPNCIRNQNLVLPLKFEDITIQDTTQHKHIGIILQNNLSLIHI